MIGQAALLAAVRVHDVNFIIAVAVRFKGDLRAVRRPDRILVLAGIVRQLREIAAVHAHQVNIPTAVPVRLKEDAPCQPFQERVLLNGGRLLRRFGGIRRRRFFTACRQKAKQNQQD